ncbi:ACP S-malonyltransferase [Thermaerobacter sp. PB12/4term]|uniref:ACP S-malonyltransferase n=1 Tax=Thermaerobacter sp. PB12/4term TaxID=2293838 RepID=UPI000E3250BC|nr:ACP S-malonyltransferase [Thermaerobacter sp. PB12/4term]QIA26909.1 ACP S-malonyltransferase [Thermaerobacter sp. PB12/4term]
MSGTAVVFPGQGAQYVGMGKDLYEQFPEAREVFAEASAAAGFDVARLCFEGPEDQLQLTEFQQPALLAVGVACWRVLAARGLEPAMAAGLSLGEYGALVVAGVLELADAARVVRLRGKFMQEAVPPGEGAMAALLGLEAGTVEDICRQVMDAGAGVVEPANYNCPGQIVVAGQRAAVEAALERARAAGARRAVLLPVSAPFHCRLMEPAARRLAGVLAEVPFRPARIPVVANVTAEPVTDPERIRELLVQQVYHPVRWEQSVRRMQREGITRLVEMGPGKTLTGFARRIDKHLDAVAAGTAEEILALVARPEGGLLA